VDGPPRGLLLIDPGGQPRRVGIHHHLHRRITVGRQEVLDSHESDQDLVRAHGDRGGTVETAAHESSTNVTDAVTGFRDGDLRGREPDRRPLTSSQVSSIAVIARFGSIGQPRVVHRVQPPPVARKAQGCVSRYRGATVPPGSSGTFAS
jgi:hypothetical protein